MSERSYWDKRWAEGDKPWDTGRPDKTLIELVNGRPLKPGKALEVGCGAGHNALWLAGQGFEVTAVEWAGPALEQAKKRAALIKAEVNWLKIDFMAADVPGAPFDFIFDRGCFHSIYGDRARAGFARRLAAHLRDGGLWLSIIGNRDDDRPGPGPPKMTALEVARAVEPYFKILEMKSGKFDSEQPVPPRAWICLMAARPVA